MTRNEREMMKELLTLKLNEEQTAVNARDMYLELGLSKSHWSKWATKNIIDNEFFEENKDYQGFALEVNGNETMNYALTLDFAKHLCMMAKTDKAHDVRNYFLKCEEELKKQPKQELSTLDILKIATAEIEKLEQENKTLALTNETQSKQLDIYLKFGDNIGLREFTKRIYTTNSIDWSETRVKEFILGLGLLITSNKKSWNLFRPYAGKAQEYFLVKSTEQEFGGKIRTQLLITPQGQAHIVEKMLSE